MWPVGLSPHWRHTDSDNTNRFLRISADNGERKKKEFRLRILQSASLQLPVPVDEKIFHLHCVRAAQTEWGHWGAETFLQPADWPQSGLSLPHQVRQVEDSRQGRPRRRGGAAGGVRYSSGGREGRGWVKISNRFSCVMYWQGQPSGRFKIR